MHRFKHIREKYKNKQNTSYLCKVFDSPRADLNCERLEAHVPKAIYGFIHSSVGQIRGLFFSK